MQAVGATVIAERGRPPLSLRVNFSWMLLGQVVYSGCQFGVLVALARLASVEAVGQFALGLAVAMPIMTFSMLHLRAIQATDARDEFAFGEYLALRLLTTGMAFIVITAFALLGTSSLLLMRMILAGGLMASADAFSDVLCGACQRRERLDGVAKALLLKGALGLVSVAIVAFAGGGAFAAAMALAIIRWFILLSCELPIAARTLGGKPGSALRPKWRWARMARLARLALPLGVVMLLISLQTHIPRYFLGCHASVADVGVFVSLITLTNLGALVVNALGQTASPRLAAYFHSGQRGEFLSLTVRLALLGASLGAFGVFLAAVAGPQILRLIHGSDYVGYETALLLLMVAAAINYVGPPLGYAATAARQVRPQPVIHAINLAITGSLAWFLAPHGVRGLSCAVLVSSITTTLLFAGLVFWALRPSGRQFAPVRRLTWQTTIN
jgi:O-antigen/teichoic acid export membrane protein